MTLVLRGATLIDGKGSDPERADVVCEGNRIRSVGEPAPPDAEAVDLGGLTVLPGLIDAHTHFGITALFDHGNVPPAVHAGRIFLACERAIDAGFTTVRDCGGVDGGLVQAIELGLVDGPRVLPSGPVLCQTGGHGDLAPPFGHRHEHGVPGLFQTSIVCDGADGVKRAAREAFRRGATQIKVCVSGGVVSLTDRIEDSQFTVEELAEAVEEARARDTYVTAHAHNVRGIRNGLLAGIECFEHGTYLDEETAVAMAEAGAALVPTLAVTRLLAAQWHDWGLTAEIAARLEGVEQAMSDSVKLAHDVGVTIGSGSDIFGPDQRRWGLELVLKAQILGPMEAIVSATQTNARILRMADEIGTVEPGKIADLIAVDGDPLAEPELFDEPDRIVLVVKDGEIVKELA